MERRRSADVLRLSPEGKPTAPSSESSNSASGEELPLELEPPQRLWLESLESLEWCSFVAELARLSAANERRKRWRNRVKAKSTLTLLTLGSERDPTEIENHGASWSMKLDVEERVSEGRW